MELTALAALPGVLQATIADDAGRLLECVGDAEPPSTAILVLAHATLSAASELGRRSGSGDCLPQRRMLLVRSESADVIPALRCACASLASPITTRIQPIAVPTRDLADALHAEPAW
jgi:hypothetical protein